MACMRRLSPEQILAAQKQVRIGSPVWGGAQFPQNPINAIRTGAYNRVPVLTGQTRDERTQSVFAQQDYIGQPVTADKYISEIEQRYGNDAEKVLREYPVDQYSSPTVALAAVEGDDLSCARLELFATMSGTTKTYVYEFDERSPPSFVSIWRLGTDFPFGATHVNDLGYLFDYLRQALPFSSAQGELSDVMIRYWTAFITLGNPNTDGLPSWPVYSSTRGEMMSFAADKTGVKDNFSGLHRCEFWAQLSG